MATYTVRPVDANFVCANPLSSNNRVVFIQDVNIVSSEVPIITVPSYPIYAYEVIFDPTNTNLQSTDVQGALVELANLSAQSASPGYTWGAQGLITAGSYLENDGTPSNIAGRLVTIQTGSIVKVFATTGIAGNYKLQLQKRNGAGYVDLVAVNMVGVRREVFDINVPIVYKEELCVLIAPDSPENPIGMEVGILLKGEVT